MPLQPGTRLASYEIVTALGAGGMGEVYRARDTRLGRDVAIKVLPASFVRDPERVARFQREAQLLASLNHPRIAAIHGIEEAAGSQFLVLELVDGETLAQRIARGPITLTESIDIAKQIAEALDAAHGRGIIHRDLKPANIALTAADQVKILDFGLAKLDNASSGSAMTDATNSPTLTLAATGAGVILGTAAYMSPEQAKGRPADKRADIWAFGCVLYEMLTGRRAFDGDDASDTLAAVLRAEPDWSALPKATPGHIRLLLKRCLEKDRQARVSEIAVARFLMDEPIAPPDTSASPTRRRWTPARVAVVAASAVVLAAAVASASAWTALQWNSHAGLVTRFVITPPSTQAWTRSGSDRDFAISPDGSHLVYRAFVNGQTQLVIRDASQLDGHVIGAVDGPGAPFFSPDGRWLGYFAGGIPELRKVSTSGGPPTTLCRFSGNPAGATWSNDGTIVFATDDPHNGLMAVSAAGGEPRPLTKLDPATEAEHVYPAFVPGSTSVVLFTVIARVAGAQQIESLDVKSGARKVVVRGGAQPEFIGKDYLVYGVGSALLYAARFDAARLELRSEPVSVQDGVFAVTSGALQFRTTRDGTLVYESAADAANAPRRLVWVDRTGHEQDVAPTERAFADPRLSPNGRGVVFENENDHDDIWTLDIARGALERQTFENDEDETPRWSPDGKWLAYSSTRAGKRFVFRRRADGSGPEEVLWTGSNHSHLDDWTPDGRGLLVTVSTASAGVGALAGLNDVILVAIDKEPTSKSLLNSRFNERGARLSADGRWISYTSDESGSDEVYVRPFPSLEGKTQVSIGGGSEAVWSARGDELFYRGRNALMSVHMVPGVPLSASAPQKLFDDHYYTKGATHIGYDVSRDGQRFLMVKELVTSANGTPSASFIVVLNWLEELRTRLSSR